MPNTVGELVALLKDPDRDVRANAAKTLASAGWQESHVASPPLSFFLGDAKGAVPALTDALKDEANEVCRSAADTLCSIVANTRGWEGRYAVEAQAVVPALIDALRHRDAVVRGRAADALSYVGREAAAAGPALLDALEDPEDRVRGAAAWALAEIGVRGTEAVSALVAALEDPVARVRGSAARALGAIGVEAKAAVPALIDALEDGEWATGSWKDPVSVNEWALSALRQIDPESAPVGRRE